MSKKNNNVPFRNGTHNKKNLLKNNCGNQELFDKSSKT
jgi:hypothetical protein